MKALFVNGSPRKNWNTHKMLESAMEGAREAGAEVDLVHLYDVVFKGCVSCFACKVKGSRTNGLCAFRDPLTPTLEKARGGRTSSSSAARSISAVPPPQRAPFWSG